MKKEIDYTDVNTVRLYNANLQRAANLGLRLDIDEEGFYLESEFNVDNLVVDNSEKYRRYHVNDIREIEVFLEAWEYSSSFTLSLEYLKGKCRQ